MEGPEERQPGPGPQPHTLAVESGALQPGAQQSIAGSLQQVSHVPRQARQQGLSPSAHRQEELWDSFLFFPLCSPLWSNCSVLGMGQESQWSGGGDQNSGHLGQLDFTRLLSQGSFLPNLTYHMLSKNMVATS